MKKKMFYEFDFAISFAGRERNIAKEISEKLSSKGLVVFYDENYKSDLLGRKLDKEFTWIYGSGTRYFIPIVSKDYVEKDWPQLEWSIAKEESQKRETEYIIPLRKDNSILLGLSDSICYIDLRKESIDDVVDMLFKKRRSEVGFIGASLREETWVATFGTLIEDVLQTSFAKNQEAVSYPVLCDALEADLMSRIRKLEIKNPRFSEASSRNGETLSVRIAFEWTPHLEALNFGNLDWWQVLEILPYDEIYETHA